MTVARRLVIRSNSLSASNRFSIRRRTIESMWLCFRTRGPGLAIVMTEPPFLFKGHWTPERATMSPS